MVVSEGQNRSLASKREKQDGFAYSLLEFVVSNICVYMHLLCIADFGFTQKKRLLIHKFLCFSPILDPFAIQSKSRPNSN